MQAVEIIARAPQPFEKIQAMIVTGDQTRDFRSAAFDSAAMRRENRDPGPLDGADMHGVVDTLGVAFSKIVITEKFVGNDRFAHQPILTPRIACISGIAVDTMVASTAIMVMVDMTEAMTSARADFEFRKAGSANPTARVPTRI